MAGWDDFERDASEVATAVRAAFARHVHHMLATVRAEGDDIDEAIVLRLNDAKDAMIATRWTRDHGVTVRQMV